MKIEPIRKTNLPKYAAALAVLCTVPMLTACGKEPEIAGGEAFVADQAPEYSEPDIAGGEAFYPDPTEIELVGEGPVDEESDPAEAPTEKTPENFAECCGEAFCAAFAAENLPVEAAPRQSDGIDCVRVSYGDASFDAALISRNSLNDCLTVCFYDGSARLTFRTDEAGEHEGTYEEMFAYYANRGAKEFAWGFADSAQRWDARDNWAPGHTAFVDIQRLGEVTAETAAQIIREARSTYISEGDAGNEA